MLPKASSLEDLENLGPIEPLAIDNSMPNSYKKLLKLAHL